MQKRFQNIELLAPAKNLEVGKVAIDAGADAVYIGGPSFGARKAAGNSLEDLAELCRYARFYRAKVLLTLNTLLREDELPEAVRLAYAYKKIGVDAIIIQDLRLAAILFATGDFSGDDGGIRLHASTQCDSRTLERVQQLEAMGFKRVVLARELSLEEIRHIRKHTKVELESFVHGALCVSYSGACYMSERMCGRSANRGECAQMCRLQYDVLDENGQELLHQKHILSLRDLDRSHLLPELLATGVTTLKIEGRLKDADYVRNVVAFYRRKLDALFEAKNSPFGRGSEGVCRAAFTPNPEKTFHRGSTAYFSTERPLSLVNMDTPKSTGEYIGRAPLPEGLMPGVTLANGDGLCFGSDGFYWPNSRIRIPAGTPVFRNYDVQFQRQLEAKDATVRVLPVSIRFAETPTGFALSAEADGTLATLECDADKVPAQNAERAESVVRQQLQKLGGTRLEAASVSIEWGSPYFLPASVLNDWRRQLVDRFTALREAVPEVPEPDAAAVRQLIRDTVGIDGASGLPKRPAPEPPHMTCKYCILFEMGCCKTRNPRKQGIPTYLRQGDRLFRIVTHCADCYMTIEDV